MSLNFWSTLSNFGIKGFVKHLIGLISMYNFSSCYAYPIINRNVGDLFSYITNVIKIDVKELNESKKNRRHEFVKKRQILMYLMKKYSSDTLVQIGWKCGRKDHATVLYSASTIEKLRSVYRDLDNQLKAYEADIEIFYKPKNK